MRVAVASVEIVVEVRIELEYFLVIDPTKQLVILDHKLVTLLQLAAARHAAEAGQVEDGVGCAHDQFVCEHRIATRSTFYAVTPVKKHTRQIK